MKHVLVLAPGDTVELHWQRPAMQPTICERLDGPRHWHRCPARLSDSDRSPRCELREGHEGPHNIGGASYDEVRERVELGRHALKGLDQAVGLDRTGFTPRYPGDLGAHDDSDGSSAHHEVAEQERRKSVARDRRK